jgi:hypothetical protein
VTQKGKWTKQKDQDTDGKLWCQLGHAVPNVHAKIKIAIRFGFFLPDAAVTSLIWNGAGMPGAL